MSGVGKSNNPGAGPITVFKPEELPRNFPAIDLARAILEVLAADLEAPERNAQISLWVAKQASNHYKSIHRLIGKVESSTDLPDWDSFDTYTAAIDPLEDISYDYGSSVEEFSKNSLITPSSEKTINDLSLLIQQWDTERSKISAFAKEISGDKFKKLSSSSDAAKDEISAARKVDDISLLEHLSQRMDDVKMQDSDLHPRPKQTLLATVRTKVKDIGTKLKLSTSTKDALTVIIIKCVMIVCFVMEKAQASRKGNFLRSPDAWKAAEILLSAVTTEIANANSDVKKLQDAYDAYINALGGTVKLPPSLLELIKLLARVRRPYQARSVAVIKVCHKLSDELKDQECLELEPAVNAAVAALKEAAKDKTEFKSMDPKKIANNSETIQKFEDLMTKLEVCFTANGLKGWDTQKKTIDDAAGLDEARLVKLLQRIKGKSG